MSFFPFSFFSVLVLFIFVLRRSTRREYGAPRVLIALLRFQSPIIKLLNDGIRCVRRDLNCIFGARTFYYFYRVDVFFFFCSFDFVVVAVVWIEKWCAAQQQGKQSGQEAVVGDGQGDGKKNKRLPKDTDCQNDASFHIQCHTNLLDNFLVPFPIRHPSCTRHRRLRRRWLFVQSLRVIK